MVDDEDEAMVVAVEVKGNERSYHEDARDPLDVSMEWDHHENSDYFAIAEEEREAVEEVFEEDSSAVVDERNHVPRRRQSLEESIRVINRAVTLGSTGKQKNNGRWCMVLPRKKHHRHSVPASDAVVVAVVGPAVDDACL